MKYSFGAARTLQPFATEWYSVAKLQRASTPGRELGLLQSKVIPQAIAMREKIRTKRTPGISQNN